MAPVTRWLGQWVRQWLGRGSALEQAPAHGPSPRWQVLESVASPAMGSVYMQVLRQAGIPVLVREWGAGSGAMGGALTGVRILVPEDRISEARDVLDVGTAGSEVTYE